MAAGRATLVGRPRRRERQVVGDRREFPRRDGREDVHPEPPAAIQLVRPAEDDRDDGRAGAQREVRHAEPERPRGPRRRRRAGLREEAQDGAGLERGLRGREIRLDPVASPARPDRDDAADPAEHGAPPSGAEDRPAVAEEDEPRFDRQRVREDERVDPGPMRQARRRSTRRARRRPRSRGRCSRPRTSVRKPKTPCPSHPASREQRRGMTPTLARSAGRPGPVGRSAISRRGRGGPVGAAARSAACRSRRGCPGGSTVHGWSSSTTGPRTAARASLIRRAVSSSSREPGSGSGAPSRQPGERAGRRGRQDPRRHPPAEVELLGAGHRERHDRRVGPERDDRPAVAERPDPAGRTADRALRHLDEDRPVARRPHAPPRRGASTPTPPRQTGSRPPSRWISRSRHARGERRRGAAQEPGPRRRRERVHHDERVHPAAVGRGDEQVAAARQVLLPGRPDPEPEDDEDDEPGDQPQEAVQDRRSRLGRAARARRGLRRRRPAPRPAPRGTRAPAAAPRRALGCRPGFGHLRPAGGPAPARTGQASAAVDVGACAGPGRVEGIRVGAQRPSAPSRRRPAVAASSSSSELAATSTGRPSAPHVATSGCVGGSSSGCPRRCRHARITRAGTMNADRDDLRGRDAEERPVVVAQGLEDEARRPVPDEEHEQQVARRGAVAAGGSRSRPARARRAARRATRTGTAGGNGWSRGTPAAREVRDPMGAIDRDAPRQRSSASRRAPG